MSVKVMNTLTQEVLGNFSSAYEALESQEWADCPNPELVDEGITTARDAGLCGDWANVARYFWVMAFVAMTDKNHATMRDFVNSAQEAEKWADPVLAAIFTAPVADEKTVRLGAQVASSDAKEAKAKVLAEMARFAESKRAEEKQEKATAAAERKDALARVAANQQSKIAVGKRYAVSKVSKAYKHAPTLADIDGVVVNTASVSEYLKDGDTVEIVSHTEGRAYGVRYYAIVRVVVVEQVTTKKELTYAQKVEHNNPIFAREWHARVVSKLAELAGDDGVFDALEVSEFLDWVKFATANEKAIPEMVGLAVSCNGDEKNLTRAEVYRLAPSPSECKSFDGWV